MGGFEDVRWVSKALSGAKSVRQWIAFEGKME